MSGSDALAADIVMLARCFCEMADTSHARVRLERVEDDGCMLFHADTLRIRMLCTYAGPGTEWLEPENVRMHELGLRGREIAGANAAIVIDAARIQQVPAWHVVMFTGRMRADTPPLVHRSAPVRSAAENRLRLCIDLPGECGC